MKFLIFPVLLITFVSCVPVERSSRKFIGDINGSIKGEYTYADSKGATHAVKYEAGPNIGFKILEDKIIQVVKPQPVHNPFQSTNHFQPITPVQPFQSGIPNIDTEETVRVHHLRNEVPADVHRTSVPQIVHSMEPPPIRTRRFKRATVHRFDGYIDGLTPEQAANIEAQYAYQQALNLLLPQIQQAVVEQGEIIIPVHHVHHVQRPGHIQDSPPRNVVHNIRVTNKPHGLHVEHIGPTQYFRRHFLTTQPLEQIQHFTKREIKEDTKPSRKPTFPLASEIELINGYTPDVWEARQAHLENYEAIKALLPKLEEEVAAQV